MSYSDGSNGDGPGATPDVTPLPGATPPRSVIVFEFEKPGSAAMSFQMDGVTTGQLDLVRSWVDRNFPGLIAQIEARAQQSQIAVPGVRLPLGVRM